MHKLIWIALFLGSSSLSWAAKEAFVVEGGMGSPEVSMYGLNDVLVKPKGDVSYLRLHLPVWQSKHQIAALTLSNQYYDGVKKEAGDSHVLAYSALGLGFSYRYRFFLLGSEFQSATVRHSLVGTSQGLKNYTFTMPSVYGGLLFRMGDLGIGVIGYSKSGTISKNQSGLSQDRTYKESGTLICLTYHWDGAKKKFFKSLFK